MQRRSPVCSVRAPSTALACVISRADNLKLTPDGRFLYAVSRDFAARQSNQLAIISRNTATGAVTLVGMMLLTSRDDLTADFVSANTASLDLDATSSDRSECIAAAPQGSADVPDSSDHPGDLRDSKLPLRFPRVHQTARREQRGHETPVLIGWSLAP